MTEPTRLISGYFDDALDARQFARLCAWLREDSRNVEQFARCAMAESNLRGAFEHRALTDAIAIDLDAELDAPAGDAANGSSMHDAMILPAIDGERAAASEPAPAASAPAVRPAAPRPASSPRKAKVARWWLGTAAALAACATLAFSLRDRSRSVPPAPLAAADNSLSTRPAAVAAPTPAAPSFASIVRGVRPVWGDATLGTSAGTALSSTQLFQLLEGCVEVEFAGGARAVLEAPCDFQVPTATKLSLFGGKVAVTAEGRARGFVVRAPGLEVIDLGTEFGVGAKVGGDATVHVFRGEVMAVPQGENARPSTVVRAGQAVRIADGRAIPVAGGAQGQAFVRSLNAVAGTLDLVDLVAGGDGTTGLRRMAINAATGASGDLPLFNGRAARPDAYVRVPGLPVVDGCFVPDGEMAVTSAGRRFDFGKTDGISYHNILAGGRATPADPYQSVVGGIDYAGPNHGLIFLHSNNGLTIDLAAVRRLHPGAALTGFTAIVGNTLTPENAQRMMGVDGSMFRTNAYVLVDGEPRFARPQLTNRDGAVPVEVPIGNGDRFLTLAVTDGGDAGNFDWILFGDPKLTVARQ